LDVTSLAYYHRLGASIFATPNGSIIGSNSRCATVVGAVTDDQMAEWRRVKRRDFDEICSLVIMILLVIDGLGPPLNGHRVGDRALPRLFRVHVGILLRLASV